MDLVLGLALLDKELEAVSVQGGALVAGATCAAAGKLAESCLYFVPLLGKALRGGGLCIIDLELAVAACDYILVYKRMFFF